MKYTTLLLLIFITGVTACNKSSIVAPPPPVVLNDEDTTVINLQYTGMFEGTPGESVMGNSNIYLNDGKYTLLLDSFSTSSGPDLHVYLSTGRVPDVFIDLGKLRADSGQQVYNIPGMPDFSEFKYVLIHCVQYNHIFGVSELK